MLITVLTLFPEQFSGIFDSSIIKRAIDKKHLQVEYVNIRDFATDAYKSVDDHPYGGGIGMILRVDIVERALQSVKGKTKKSTSHTVLLDPQGIPYTQQKATALATTYTHLILLCGHYEGVDERVRSLVDEEISIGDYVLTGGEIPAMVIIDSVTRLLPGVLARPKATQDESFTQGLLEHPQYTRPEEYKGEKVPGILLSGNHKHIEAWRKDEAKKKTHARRPDLLTAQTG